MIFRPSRQTELIFYPLKGIKITDDVQLLLRQYYADPRRSKTNIIPFG